MTRWVDRGRCRAMLAFATILLAAACGTVRTVPPAQPIAESERDPQASPGASLPPPAIAEGGEEAQEAVAPDLTLYEVPGWAPPRPQPTSLVEAAAAAHAQREAEPHPVAIVTNENLGEYAARGQITVASVPLRIGQVEEASDANEREAYWRSTMLAARQQWRDAVESLEALDRRVAELRAEFYATDDPGYRDGEIRPAWDLALADLAAANEAARAGEEEVKRLLEAGRRQGALPGWLRAGIELEPRPAARDLGQLPTVEPIEPRRVDE